MQQVITMWYPLIKPRHSCITHLQRIRVTKVHKWPLGIDYGVGLGHWKIVARRWGGMNKHLSKVGTLLLN